MVTLASRAREIIGLAAILLLALALRVWGLEQNGWGAEYYAAAVRSMALNPHNFFFAAFDPQGFISVDKPPVALWLQVASVQLFGFTPLAVLVPQALEGVLSVWVLFHLVRRRFSAMAALLAALFLAVTPIAVAVNRTNNMDSALLLALLLAAWTFMKAAEESSRRWLCATMVVIGVAFNIKMLAALILMPTFFAVYFIAARKTWPRRVADLALAGVVLAASALPWVLAYEWTPPDSRPWVGSSTRNSMLDLLVGANGIERFVSRLQRPAAASRSPLAAGQDAGNSAGARPRTTVARLFVRAPTGPLRLADGQLAAQVMWLLPFAAMALAIGAAPSRLRRPLAPAHLALLFWFLWIVNYVAVYSYAGGTFHFYYLSTLAPALAALAGIGLAALWEAYSRPGWRAALLPATLLLAVGWQLHVQGSALGVPFDALRQGRDEWLGWLHALLIGAGLLAFFWLTLVLALRSAPGADGQRLAGFALGAGVAALLVVPMAWTLSSVLRPGPGVVPSADLYRLAPAGHAANDIARARLGQSVDTSKLVALLQANRSAERYLLATMTTHLAAPIVIASGESVMATGGFHGLDRAIDVEQFARLVQTRQVRFATVGDATPVSRSLGAEAAGKPLADWIRSHGTVVPASLWRAPGLARGIELYDLRPEAGFVNKAGGTPCC